MAWVQYAADRRLDPATGETQYFTGRDWQSVPGDYFKNFVPQYLKEPQSATVPSNYDQLAGAYGSAYMGPTRQQLDMIRLVQAQQQAGQGTAAAPTATSAPQRSYLGQNPTIQAGGAGAAIGTSGAATGVAVGGSTMNWDQVARQIGLQSKDVAAFAQRGWSPDEVLNSFQTTGQTPQGIKPPAQAAPVDTTQPETRGLQQMAQIDPQGYQQRVAMAGGVDEFVKQAQQEAALGSTLDASTQREVEQATRAGQVARGNVYGTPQLVQEAMARGSAGEARAQQRRQALAGALGMQQSYLQSGQGIGDIANTLYNQGFARNLQARQAAQGGALSYLGSGQTPYQAGASYLQNAEQRAATAAQGGPQYNPQALGQQYAGAQFPDYGLQMSTNAANWYNSLAAQNPMYGGQQKNRMMGAGAGALGGAASGALAGAAAGGVGAIPGAIIGGIGGAASGYFAAPDRM